MSHAQVLSLEVVKHFVQNHPYRYGEVMNINLMRDGKTGKSRGFCFLCYQDQRSTVLAVDNLNGITLLKRMIRVDHVEQYKVPKYKENADEETKRLWEEGCAPKPIRVDPQERLREMEKSAEEAKEKVVSLKEDDDLNYLKRKIKAERKKKKKEKKKAKEERKKLKKLMKSEERNLENDWKDQSKLLDKNVKDDEIYGHNKHFNFGKKNEEVEEPTHNPRPDFEKLHAVFARAFVVLERMLLLPSRRELFLNGRRDGWLQIRCRQQIRNS
ncbi:hypothetical protein Y032_0021g350 [Ancylostoma ceylanicum]|uniref:RRM domain-containing protein n=1 Tax=Ancylostoma ceylanicum TaxID=53326 RepID=A0A016UZR5_9BILA|nr:hypothetical protein Y032_0021g350 [Ancylostoma ceylanicum]